MKLKLAACLLAGSVALPGKAVAEPSHVPAAAHAPLVSRSSLDVGPTGKRITQVVIDNPLGDVRVEGYDGASLQITAIKRAPDDDTMDRLRVSLIPDASGPVHIVTAADVSSDSHRVDKHDVRIDLIIRAPRDARVDGRVGDGRLELVNMDAGGTLEATAGAISVRNVSGPVSANSIDAPVSMSDVFGVVDTDVLQGDITLDTVLGDRLSASAHRGRIEAKKIRSRRVDLITTNGNIHIIGDAAVGSQWSIRSVHGTIDVQLHADGGIAVRGRGAHVAIPGAQVHDGWATATMGEVGTSSVVMSTRYGDVQFGLIN